MRDLIARGSLDDARARLVALQRQRPDDVEARFMSVDLAVRAGDIDDAVALANAAVAAAPSRPIAARAGGLAGVGLIGLGRVDDGLRFVSRAAALYGELGDVAQRDALLGSAAAALRDVGAAERLPGVSPRAAPSDSVLGGLRARAEAGDVDGVLADTACERTSLFFELPCRAVLVGVLLRRADADPSRRLAYLARARSLWPKPDAALPLSKLLASAGATQQ